MGVLKLLGKSFLFLVVGYLGYGLLVPFLWGPIYDFPEPKPFSGEHFYNPYASMDSMSWIKGNFHAHANPYGVLTDGRDNTSEALFNRYDSLNYRSFAVTNYMHIDTFNASKQSYIPAYEHGYSPVKYHQLALGANKVNYFDYPLFQWTSNKQYVINMLRKNTEVLAIAHPEFMGAYSKKDAQKLCNYDLVEVMNQRKYSFDFWDAALSAGHAVWILGNDDVHDLSSTVDYGMQATLINSVSTSSTAVFEAMKEGKTMGYAPVNSPFDSHNLKLTHANSYPRLNYFKVSASGKIEGGFNKPIKEFHVYAQNGEEIDYQFTEHQNNLKIYAQFKAEHQYLRFKINFEDADLLWLNPVIRYDGKGLPQLQANVNWLKTILYRGFAWILFIMALKYGWLYRQKKKQHT